MSDVDWETISDIFDEMEGAIVGLTFLDGAEWKNEHYSWLTYGLIPSGIKCINEIPVSFASRRWNPTQVLEFAALAYGVARSPGAADGLPQWLPQRIKDSPHDINIVRDAVREKTISTAFILALSRISQLYGLIEFMGNNEFSAELSSRVERNRVTEITIKKHWYAYWVRENAPRLATDQTRHAAGQLAQVCRDIREGELEPWGPYPREWYTNMLSEADKPQLTKRFLDVGRQEIKELSSHPLVTRDVLPPLKRRGFAVKA